MSKINIFSLGGLDEMGKNTYVVEVNNDIFVFDCGIKYATNNMFGIDYIIPDYEYLIKNKKKIKGVFITHGHYENMGAALDLLKSIPTIKFYVTKFTKFVNFSQVRKGFGATFLSWKAFIYKAFQWLIAPFPYPVGEKKC